MNKDCLPLIDGKLAFQLRYFLAQISGRVKNPGLMT